MDTSREASHSPTTAVTSAAPKQPDAGAESASQRQAGRGNLPSPSFFAQLPGFTDLGRLRPVGLTGFFPAGPISLLSERFRGSRSRCGEPQVLGALVSLRNRLLLLPVTPEGVNTLTEITDPHEVAHHSALCRRNSPVVRSPKASGRSSSK